jgi:hypothetical protein
LFFWCLWSTARGWTLALPGEGPVGRSQKYFWPELFARGFFKKKKKKKNKISNSQFLCRANRVFVFSFSIEEFIPVGRVYFFF